jgi:hypothetical protein
MRIAAALAFAAVMLSAAAARAEETELPQRYPPSSVRPKLVVGGLAVTGLAYGGALLTASLTADEPGSSELQIPIVGPWMSIGKIECPKSDPECGFTLYLRGILTAVDGLMQLGGLGIVGEGLFMKTEASPAAGEKEQGIWIRPAPVVTGTTTGIGVIGTF